MARFPIHSVSSGSLPYARSVASSIPASISKRLIAFGSSFPLNHTSSYSLTPFSTLLARDHMPTFGSVMNFHVTYGQEVCEGRGS